MRKTTLFLSAVGYISTGLCNPYAYFEHSAQDHIITVAGTLGVKCEDIDASKSSGNFIFRCEMPTRMSSYKQDPYIGTISFMNSAGNNCNYRFYADTNSIIGIDYDISKVVYIAGTMKCDRTPTNNVYFLDKK